MNKLRAALLTILIMMMAQGVASAHVVVRPAEVLTSSFQTFTMGVPNEKEIDVTEVKLVMPDGLLYVSPTVKAGWNITAEKTGEGEEAPVKSITWTGGLVPAGQRDDFSFSAKVPDAKQDLQWKAYQTYADGVTVSWDKSDEEMGKDGTSGPFSATSVVEHTEAEEALEHNEEDAHAAKSAANRATVVALAALALAVFAYSGSRKTPRK